jgi:nucleoside-diphosphate-sugar epimerase
MDRLRASYEAGVKEFNFISSWYVYGKPTFSTSTISNGKIHVPFFRETDHCNPTGFYSITKRTAEQLVIEFCEQYQINWRIIRLSNVYGFDPKSSSKKNILHFLVDKLRNNEDVALYGIMGPMWRDYVHIKDVSRAIMHLSQKAPLNTIYNVGSGPSNAKCLEDLVKLAKNHLESESKIEFIRIHEGSIPGHIEAASLSNDKLLTTGFRFEIPIEKGLLELCNGPKSFTADPTSQMKKSMQQSSI